MTPHIAVLLATLIQPSGANQGQAFLRPPSSVMAGAGAAGLDPVIPAADPGATELAPASRPTLVFSFPNRHDQLAVRWSRDLTSDEVRDFSHFVRCYRTNKEKSIAPHLIEIVLAAAAHFGVDSVEIISGYRARPYGAPHSKHFLGQALDIRLPGIPSARLSAWIWATYNNVGVGYYPRQNFVHVDTRDGDIRWVEQSRHGETGHARYFTRTGREMMVQARAMATSSAGYTLASQPAPGARAR